MLKLFGTTPKLVLGDKVNIYGSTNGGVVVEGENDQPLMEVSPPETEQSTATGPVLYFNADGTANPKPYIMDLVKLAAKIDTHRWFDLLSKEDMAIGQFTPTQLEGVIPESWVGVYAVPPSSDASTGALTASAFQLTAHTPIVYTGNLDTTAAFDADGNPTGVLQLDSAAVEQMAILGSYQVDHPDTGTPLYALIIAMKQSAIVADKVTGNPIDELKPGAYSITTLTGTFNAAGSAIEKWEYLTLEVGYEPRFTWDAVLLKMVRQIQDMVPMILAMNAAMKALIIPRLSLVEGITEDKMNMLVTMQSPEDLVSGFRASGQWDEQKGTRISSSFMPFFGSSVYASTLAKLV